MEPRLSFADQLKVFHLNTCIKGYKNALHTLANEPLCLARQENRNVVIQYFIDLIADTQKEIDEI